MNLLKALNLFHLPCRRLACVCLLIFGGCSGLGPSPVSQPTLYTFDLAPITADSQLFVSSIPKIPLTLLVSAPRASAGFSSSQIVYVRENYQIGYFAHSQWIDPPARMLEPLLTSVLDKSNIFSAVVSPSNAAFADIRLDTEIVRLQHEFIKLPSQVRFTLRATLVNQKTRRVILVQEFDTTIQADADTPYAGIVAANLAIQRSLLNLTYFCSEALSSYVLQRSP